MPTNLHLATDITGATAIVVGTLHTDDGVVLEPHADALGINNKGWLTAALATVGATGKADEVVKVPTLGMSTAPLVVAVGLGNQGDPITSERIRRSSGNAARVLEGVTYAASVLSLIDLTAAAEGTLMGGYQFGHYKTNKASAPVATLTLMVPNVTKNAVEAVAKAVTVAGAVMAARDLVNTPPNDLYPAVFAQRAVALGETVGLETEVLDEQALHDAGYGGILGVGSGSTRPPRLVRLRYRSTKPKAKVALVGKGVTFDTGGISIKGANNMHHQTADMAGAAAMVASVVLAAQLHLPLDVTATIPMVENMPSGSAYRPGDVLTMYGGKTVEVLNTDAEGRLILADAIVRACQDDPDYLLDTATLTGAALMALGRRTIVVQGTDGFREHVAEVARETGEGGWAMPFLDELRASLDSDIADLVNAPINAAAGSAIRPGMFLREFVPEGVQWVHLDVAGPAYNPDAVHGYTTKGGTGVPVRTVGAVLADIAVRAADA